MTAAKKTAPEATTKKKATVPKYLSTFLASTESKAEAEPVVRPGRHAGRPTSLTTLRKGAGITQTEIAERSGMSQPYVSKLEAGEGEDVMVSTLRKYVEALGAELELHVVVKGGGSWRVKL